jgi:hypothetical protein
MDLRWWRKRSPAGANEPAPSVGRDAVTGVVMANDFTSHPGTPAASSGDRHGIRLNAPRRIVVGRLPVDPLFGDHGPRALVWGHCLIPNTPGVPLRDHREHITLVAVDLAQGRAFSGRVFSRPPIGSVHVSRDRPEPVLPNPGSASGGPFNPDLIGVCGIPLVDADYEIFARLDGWRSNVIDVQVRFALGG